MNRNIVIATIFLFPVQSWACSCAQSSLEENYETHHVVAELEVVSIERHRDRENVVSIKPVKIWKSDSRPVEKLYTSSDTASCGYEFEVGKKYIVFAYSPPRRWLVWQDWVPWWYPWGERTLVAGHCSGILDLEDEYAKQEGLEKIYREFLDNKSSFVESTSDN